MIIIKARILVSLAWRGLDQGKGHVEGCWAPAVFLVLDLSGVYSTSYTFAFYAIVMHGSYNNKVLFPLAKRKM